MPRTCLPHIYVALGLWHEVVASNEVSYAASVNRMERQSGQRRPFLPRFPLAALWLPVQGRVEDARRIMEQMMEQYTGEAAQQERAPT